MAITITDVTRSGSNTTSTTLGFTMPSYSDGDLVIVNLNFWQNNNQTNSVSFPAGPNSETLTVIDDDYGGSGNYDLPMIGFAWFIADGAYVGGAWNVTASIGTRFDGTIMVVPEGEFDATTPIGATSSDYSVTDNSSPTIPAFSAGASDGDGEFIGFIAVDQDPITGRPSGWTALITHDEGRASIELAHRDTTVTDSESISSSSWTISSDARTVYGYIIRPYVAPSSSTNMKINIGDSWKTVEAMKINIGDSWKEIVGAWINVGDSWKQIYTSAISNGLLTGLTAYYKADTSGSFPDAHGSNDGTINGATYTASGKINGAYSYDGINDYISSTSNSNTSYSTSMWIKKGTITDSYGMVFQQTGSSSIKTRQIYCYNNGDLYAYNGGTVGDTGLVNDSNWHLVGLSYNGTTLKLIVDGVVVASGATTQTTQSYTSDLFTIGDNTIQSTARRCFAGEVDEIGDWSRELTDAEWLSLYNSGNGLPYTDFTT